MARGNRRIFVATTLIAVPTVFLMGSFTNGESPELALAVAHQGGEVSRAFAVADGSGQPRVTAESANGPALAGSPSEIRQTGGLLSGIFGNRSKPSKAAIPVPPQDSEPQSIDWEGIPYHDAEAKKRFAEDAPLRNPEDPADRSSDRRRTTTSDAKIVRGGSSRTLDATRKPSEPAARVATRAVDSRNAEVPKPEPLSRVIVTPRKVERNQIEPLSRKLSSRRSSRRTVTPLAEDVVEKSDKLSKARDAHISSKNDALPSAEKVASKHISPKPEPKVARRQLPEKSREAAKPAPRSLTPSLTVKQRAKDDSMASARRQRTPAAPADDAPESPSDIGQADIPYAASSALAGSGKRSFASPPMSLNSSNLPQKITRADEDRRDRDERFDSMRPELDQEIAAAPQTPDAAATSGAPPQTRTLDTHRDAYQVGSYPQPPTPPSLRTHQAGPPREDRFAYRGDITALETGRRDVSIEPITGPNADGNPKSESTAVAPGVLPTENNSASVASELPGIRVLTQGPREIMIRRTHQYEVRVENRGAIDVRGVQVETLVPDWAAVEGQNVTSGEVQSTRESEAEKLSWNIDRLPAGQIARMFVRIKASRSGTFDLDVDWTLKPQTNVAKIHVQEPRLELTIDGPEKVIYGQSQTYRVRVLNPGDGMAPNVVFTLSPESPTPQTQRIGDIPAGKEAQFEVELTAQDLGDLKIHGLATGDLELRAEAAKSIRVAAAKLEAVLAGPELKYQNTSATYYLELHNNGAATSNNVVATLRLPTGVEYLGGIEEATQRGKQLFWKIDELEPNTSREYEFQCKMAATGDQQFAFECEGSAAGEAKVSIATNVSAIADLVLSVEDPPAPAPVGKEVTYEIVIRNRGSKAATDVKIIAQFSHGIEPQRIEGATGQVLTGQVVFDPVKKIAAGQERSLRVIATAESGGHHRFRTEVRSGETVLVSEEATHYMKPQSERVSRRSSESQSR